MGAAMRAEDNIKDSLLSSSLFKISILPILLLASLGLSPSEIRTDDDIKFDSVEILSKSKSWAESRVRMIRSLARDNEISKTELSRLELEYDAVRATVNSGIDRLLVELETTGESDSSEPFDRIAIQVSDQVEDFLIICDEMIFGGKRGVGTAIEAGAKVVDTVVNALMDIWKTLHGEKNERHAMLIKRLKGLKWQRFSKIE